jgi:hypothetical protein
MKMYRSLILLALTAGASLAGDKDALNLAALKNAEALWQAANLNEYSYTLIHGGAFGYTTYRVRIRDGTCGATSRETIMGRSGSWARVECGSHTVEGVFATLRSQLEAGTTSAQMYFDDALGYPTELSIEPDTELEDQTWYVSISDFRARGKRGNAGNQ